VLLAASAASLDHMLRVLMGTLRAWGLIVNVPKTKRMVIGSGPAPVPAAAAALPADAARGPVEHVQAFKYLGVLTTAEGTQQAELRARKAEAARVFNSMEKRVWRVHAYSDRLKGELYKAYVLSILLYGSEVWAPSQGQLHVLHVFHLGCLRRMLGLSLRDCVSADDLYSRTNTRPITDLVRERHLAMIGRAQRAGAGRYTYCAMYAHGLPGAAFVGPGRHDIQTHYDRDLQAVGLQDTYRKRRKSAIAPRLWRGG